MAKLGEVCKVVSGSTPKTSIAAYWDGDIKWITPAELNEDTFYIMDSVRHITEEGKEKTGLSYLPKGTVILSSRAPIGKTAISGCEMCCNQGFKNLICSDAIYNEYLYFFLKSKTDYLNSLGRGATFKEISKSIVENIEIPLPEVNQQKEIAEKFKKLEQLISLRKQQLDKMNELVKARFVEMFGEILINSMGWVETEIGAHCFVTKLAGFEYTQYIHYENSGEVVMVKAQNIKNGKLNDKDLSYISAEVSELLPRSQLMPGDIVMTYVGANIGDVAVIDNKYKYHLAPNVAKIRPDLSVYNSVFLMKLLMYMNPYIVKNSADTAKAALGMSRIRKLKAIVPPLSLQNQFAAFVERVDQQKQTVQQSLEKLELMEKALMQEYFG